MDKNLLHENVRYFTDEYIGVLIRMERDRQVSRTAYVCAYNHDTDSWLVDIQGDSLTWYPAIVMTNWLVRIDAGAGPRNVDVYERLNDIYQNNM